MDGVQARALFRGPMVSVATPFTEGCELDLRALRENIRLMIDRGMCTGKGVLLVAAAGGEFPMLDMSERKAVIDASVEAAEGRIPIAASMQFVGTREAVELARHAREAGVQLGQLSAPYYYPPTDGDIVGLFEAVAGESGLPLMIYNNWWVTGNMNVDMVERLARIPGVVALKWSAPAQNEYSEGLYRFADSLAVIDNQGQYVWAHMLGTVGFITHVSNFWPEYPLALWDALEAGRYEELIALLRRFQRPWHRWVGRVVQETEGEGPFIKAAMELVGLRAGPPRPPARRVSAELCRELRAVLDEANVPLVV